MRIKQRKYLNNESVTGYMKDIKIKLADLFLKF